VKSSMILKRLLPALALLLATSAFAATKGSFNIYEPVSVNGHQLKPGQYQALWDGAGPNVEVSILSQGKLVTTSSARLIELSSKEQNDAIVFGKDDDGTSSLREIDFAGKKYKLDFHNEPPADSSTSPGNQ
jgi:hypothetical protein